MTSRNRNRRQDTTLCLCELGDLLSQQTYPVQEIIRGSCELTEEDSQDLVIYSFTLTHCARKAKIVKIAGSQPNVFDDDYTEICDYLIFVPSNDGVNAVEVVFCELKKTVNMKGKHPYKAGRQIKGTIPLLQYIIEGMNVHFNKKIMVKKEHYVLLCENLKKVEDVNSEVILNNLESDSDYEVADKAISRNEGADYVVNFQYENLPISIIEISSDSDLTFGRLIEIISG